MESQADALRNMQAKLAEFAEQNSNSEATPNADELLILYTDLGSKVLGQIKTLLHKIG